MGDGLEEGKSWPVPELNRITERIIGCAYKVSNELGCGFVEKVYENSLAVELAADGLKFQQQFPIKVFYRGTLVGEYVADILVEDVILVELKAVKSLSEAHGAQCINYLRATGLKVALLLNFGNPKVEIKRFANLK
jgi:GxxExxY protein